MFPGVPMGGAGEKQVGLSYSGVLVAGARDRLLAELTQMRFTGYLGPQEGRWLVAVSGNPLGKVASKKRRVDDVARDLAAVLGTVAMAIEVTKDERLRLLTFDGDVPLPAYDSNPPDADDAEITIDDFGNPVLPEAGFVDGEMVAAALLTTFEVEPDDDEDDPLAELLNDDLGEDTSESERLVGVLRILGLPTWIVSSDSLPKRVPGGPDKDEVTRLGAGRAGVQGRLAEAITRPARPRPRHED